MNKGSEYIYKADSGIHEGHRDRMRKRFIISKAEGFSEHELLEMLLYCPIPRKNTNGIAHSLIKRFGSLHAVLNAEIKDLIKVDGVGKKTAVFLKSFLKVVEAYNKREESFVRITSTKDCVDFLFDRYKAADKEWVSAMCLDEECNVLQWKVLCEGGLQSASFNIKDLVSMVVECEATAVVLAHNHPVGVPYPSSDDVASTVVLRQALGHINIALLDHIILVGDDDYISLANSPVHQYIFTN